MKLMIFGAGASVGAQMGLPQAIRAPLVDELFATSVERGYLKFAAEVGLTELDLKGFQTAFQSAGGSLERWLTQKWDEYQSSQSEFSRRSLGSMFGRLTYYMWRLMQEVSDTYPSARGYNTLLQRLADEGDEY